MNDGPCMPSDNAMLTWQTTTWPAATPGRPSRRALRPATPQLKHSPGASWDLSTPGSASIARPSNASGSPCPSHTSGRPPTPAGSWPTYWPIPATPTRQQATCQPPARPGSRPCRSSTICSCQTTRESAASSNKSPRLTRRANRRALTHPGSFPGRSGPRHGFARKPGCWDSTAPTMTCCAVTTSWPF
jgi:hypothetical protein